MNAYNKEAYNTPPVIWDLILITLYKKMLLSGLDGRKWVEKPPFQISVK